jgi:hypothetical protein
VLPASNQTHGADCGPPRNGRQRESAGGDIIGRPLAEPEVLSWRGNRRWTFVACWNRRKTPRRSRRCTPLASGVAIAFDSGLLELSPASPLVHDSDVKGGGCPTCPLATARRSDAPLPATCRGVRSSSATPLRVGSCRLRSVAWNRPTSAGMVGSFSLISAGSTKQYWSAAVVTKMGTAVPGRSGAAERFLRTAPTLSDNACSVNSASGDPVYASYRRLSLIHGRDRRPTSRFMFMPSVVYSL